MHSMELVYALESRDKAASTVSVDRFGRVLVAAVAVELAESWRG